ncbi:MAG: ribose-phosphate pyrophosphokinase [Eubacterium sp.]|nr:ribose-phosphate pyrophosphokinase [Eubacterium sp.]
MAQTNLLGEALPLAPLKIVALPGCEDLAKTVDKFIVDYRKGICKDYPAKKNAFGYLEDSYLLDCECPRFGSGEAKGTLLESVRGADLFLIVDVCNYSITYNAFGNENHMSPDDHYQNLKRIIDATIGACHRINVIMPFLYESRQHKRSRRESLDAAACLRELVSMGVSNIITFDAHDPRVANAIPLTSFENFFPTYQFLKALLKSFKGLDTGKDKLMIISPDEGAMSRAVYFSNVLGVDMGMFYKRRDYAHVVNGKNPIIAHEFLGAPVEGKTCIVIDDMISSGGSMLDVASQLKQRGASRVIVCVTYGLFTEGLEKFDKYYEKGIIDKVISTNLIYQPQELLDRPWYASAKMGKYMANIIDALNHDVSINKVRDNTYKINKLLRRLKEEKVQ